MTAAGKTTEFSTQAEGAANASNAAGFTVLPVINLPDGFTVSTISVTDPAAGNSSRMVNSDVKGATGNAVVTQVNERQEVTGGTVIQTSFGRAFYEIVKDNGVTYYLVTDDKTYSVALVDSRVMDREQAMEVLRGFLTV